MKILITGAAGFIGSNLTNYLKGTTKHEIFTLDKKDNGYIDFVEDIRNYNQIFQIFTENKFDKVIHLAGKPGVRESGSNPYIYLDNNIIGFQIILDACVKTEVKQLIYASSSSVYGDQDGDNEDAKCDAQHSVYAVTKKENENMAYVYSHNYGLKTTGLRLFSVFGYGMREDLAIYKFVYNIFNYKPIEVYGDGTQERDYTPVRYVCEYVRFLIDYEQENNFEIYNLGNGEECPVSVNKLIEMIQEITSMSPKVVYLPENPQDVQKTCANDFKIRTLFTPQELSFREELTKYIDYMIKHGLWNNN